MLSKFKPVAFDAYGRRRPRRRVPGWLWLLLIGIASGALGVIYVQERHLPPRLSSGEAARLMQSLAQTEAERERLSRELALTAGQLESALGEKKALTDDLAASRDTIAGLRADVAALVAALPPDPRGGEVAVRAARFAAADGQLSYDIILTRDGGGQRPINGVMQLVVAGDTARGSAATIDLQPVALTLGSHGSLRGRQPLPQGFTPRQTTVRVLDRPGGRLLGQRVLLVR